MLHFDTFMPTKGQAIIVYPHSGGLDLVTCVAKKIHIGMFKGYADHETERVYWSLTKRGKEYEQDELKGWNRMAHELETHGGAGHRNFDANLEVLWKDTVENNANMREIWFVDETAVENGKPKDGAELTHSFSIGLRNNEYEALKRHFKRRAMQESVNDKD